MKTYNNIEKAITARGCKIPSKLHILDEKDHASIIMDGKLIQEENMQEDGNAFEGWAIAAYLCSKRPVILDIDDNSRFQYEGYAGNGHLGRFLYRALRFSQQYEWLKLSEYLEAEVIQFGKYLSSGVFLNNVGVGDAGDKKKIDDENAVEAKLAENGILRKVIKSIDIGDGDVHRQLPVGLFSEKVEKNNAVFTGGKSAIDLWLRNKDEINVIELKTNSPMLGIITEIFFYSNYVYDLVTNDGLFQLSNIPKDKKSHRGYEELAAGNIHKVNGIMLADDKEAFHPWVNNEVVKVLNDNHAQELNYFLDRYHLEDI